MKERDDRMRDAFRASALFAKWLMAQDTFAAFEFSAYAKSHGLFAPQVRSHIASIIKSYKWAGLIERTGDFRQPKSCVPPQIVWRSNLKKKDNSNE